MGEHDSHGKSITIAGDCPFGLRKIVIPVSASRQSEPRRIEVCFGSFAGEPLVSAASVLCSNHSSTQLPIAMDLMLGHLTDSRIFNRLSRVTKSYKRIANLMDLFG